MNYTSDIILGDEYQDELTGITGKATSVTFFLHGCERVLVEFVAQGKVETEPFDAPRLIHVPSGSRPSVSQTGGVRPGAGRPPVNRR